MGEYMMGILWNLLGNGVKISTNKPKNFDKCQDEIGKMKIYIKEKREAFYQNNKIKEK